jgi:hypothetical protein
MTERHDTQSRHPRPHSPRKRGRGRWRLAAEIAAPLLVAFIVHILNPLFANTVGQFGPFATDIEYIPNQHLAYERGCAMIRRAATEHQSHIINTRNTGKNPSQPALWEEIQQALNTSDVQYTRSIYYEKDSDLVDAAYFLKHLGTDRKFRLIVTVHGGEFPSCVITDKEAIFGFNDGSGVLTRALYISSPQKLVDDWREVVRRVVDNPLYSITLKDFGETVPGDAVDNVIARGSERLGVLLKQVRQRGE